MIRHDGSIFREEFYTKSIGKNSKQVKAYWSKQIFTGKGRPPKEVKGSTEVVHIIASQPNSIGYIDRSALVSDVKPVLVLK